MADVTGPISTLPGSLHSVPDGQECDEHSVRLAVKRVQGETDSFGSEMIDMCQECYDTHLAAIEAIKDELKFCERCHHEKRGVRPTRDLDEGQTGPLYDMCPECRSEMNRSFMDDEDGVDADDDCFDPLQPGYDVYRASEADR